MDASGQDGRVRLREWQSGHERLRDSLLSLTRRRQRLSQKLLLLVTIQRSGSTWLFDTLRCHPLIEMIRRATIFRQLELSGRRYPRDLSGRDDATLNIEVEAGRWDRIPDPCGKSRTRRLGRPVYAIEKSHPTFFAHDVDGFLNRLERIRCPDVKLIYHVRDPADSIRSFLAYQRRNSSWYRDTRPHEVPVEYRKSLEVLRKLCARRPGLVVDYSDLTEDLQAVLRRICDFLGLKHSSEAWWDHFVQEATTATTASIRGDTPFFGPGAKDPAPKPSEELPGTRADLDACYDAYRALRMDNSA